MAAYLVKKKKTKKGIDITDFENERAEDEEPLSVHGASDDESCAEEDGQKDDNGLV